MALCVIYAFSGTHNVSSLADLNGREVFYVASAIYIHKDFRMKGLANDIALVNSKYFQPFELSKIYGQTISMLCIVGAGR